MRKLIFNNTCFFGIDSIDQISAEIQYDGYKKCFIITDDNLISCGIYQKIINVLDRAKIEYKMYSEITSKPTVKDIKNAYNAFKRSKTDLILAVGGGSVIDTAKAVSIIATNPDYKDILSLNGYKNNLNAPLAVYAVPTTAGTAAEISKCLIIKDEANSKNIVCLSDDMLPKKAFIDAELMTTMPDIVTLSSGFIALGHAVESMISKNATALSNTLSKDAIKLIVENLPNSYDNPDDLESRENMAYASYIAGLAYTNAGLGLANSMAHAICSEFKIEQGIALAMVLPTVLKYNMYSTKSYLYKNIAEAFDINTTNMTIDQICRASYRAIDKFKNQFNVPKKLSDYGIKEQDLDTISLKTFEDFCTLSNPRETTVTDIYMLFKKLL